eukprot:COSAG04_NODE_1402_length_6917_cov_4.721473_7_plen_238_part_00
MSNSDTRLCKYSVAQLRKGVTRFRRRINRLPVKGFLELHAADKNVRSMMESASGKRLSFKGFMAGVDLMSAREQRELKQQIKRYMHGATAGQMDRHELSRYVFHIADSLCVDWDPIFSSLPQRKRLPRGCRTEPRPGHGKPYRPPAERPKRPLSEYNRFVQNTLKDRDSKARHRNATQPQLMRAAAKLWREQKEEAANAEHAQAVHREDMLAQADEFRRRNPSGKAPRIPRKRRVLD